MHPVTYRHIKMQILKIKNPKRRKQEWHHLVAVRGSIYPELEELVFVIISVYAPSHSLSANFYFTCIAFLQPLLQSRSKVLGVIYPSPRSHGWLITLSLASDMNSLQASLPSYDRTSANCEDAPGFTSFLYHPEQRQNFRRAQIMWSIIRLICSVICYHFK